MEGIRSAEVIDGSWCPINIARTSCQRHGVNNMLYKTENLKKFLRIFPFAATTCISVQRLGDPAPTFDMVIMDGASWCNTAVSLVPILRGGVADAGGRPAAAAAGHPSGLPRQPA